MYERLPSIMEMEISRTKEKIEELWKEIREETDTFKRKLLLKEIEMYEYALRVYEGRGKSNE